MSQSVIAVLKRLRAIFFQSEMIFFPLLFLKVLEVLWGKGQKQNPTDRWKDGMYCSPGINTANVLTYSFDFSVKMCIF